jgi:hypothetical protein
MANRDRKIWEKQRSTRRAREELRVVALRVAQKLKEKAQQDADCGALLTQYARA